MSESRVIDLLMEYGLAKFGDGWWPGDAYGVLSDAEAQELATLLGAREAKAEAEAAARRKGVRLRGSVGIQVGDGNTMVNDFGKDD